jgi:hypothetical protein
MGVPPVNTVLFKTGIQSESIGDVFPGLKAWAILFSPFGRLEHARDNVQIPRALLVRVLALNSKILREQELSEFATGRRSPRRGYPACAAQEVPLLATPTIWEPEAVPPKKRNFTSISKLVFYGPICRRLRWWVVILPLRKLPGKNVYIQLRTFFSLIVFPAILTQRSFDKKFAPPPSELGEIIRRRSPNFNVDKRRHLLTLFIGIFVRLMACQSRIHNS